MKKIYEMPLFEVSMVDHQDVITSSQVEPIDNYVSFSHLRGRA